MSCSNVERDVFGMEEIKWSPPYVPWPIDTTPNASCLWRISEEGWFHQESQLYNHLVNAPSASKQVSENGLRSLNSPVLCSPLRPSWGVAQREVSMSIRLHCPGTGKHTQHVTRGAAWSNRKLLDGIFVACFKTLKYREQVKLTEDSEEGKPKKRRAQGRTRDWKVLSEQPALKAGPATYLFQPEEFRLTFFNF